MGAAGRPSGRDRAGGTAYSTLMKTTRLEAFSDGVLAIIITIMVLELHVPNGDNLAALAGQATGLLTYLLSFVFVGIYWNNHHHMFQLVERVTGGILWANLALLFALSLVPVSTAWMDGTGFARVPVVTYGANLLLAAMCYSILARVVVRSSGGRRLAEALGNDVKSWLSLTLYAVGIAVAFLAPVLGLAAFVVVAVIWLVPDRRVERLVSAEQGADTGNAA